ncbi:hypothetical protein SAMN04488550_4583 [Gordonia malaquae]|uniref:Uncharacterized protein n=1 Tax=Gordonia malaquae NBRC 108250 TaxID=1223542 RepID=M3TKG2_GORML|nr:hypothetical protein [Gordonia malaquae]GAC81981.1 hypothetical protein GM1_055_00120 [Gordonia malaquae NBRC 108250]SEE57675.1 hypothetical protein SAMN04488550_4572 [Gordonia malaquae]SEE57970.1 hypothetical protein SAMN04488550_4583 [Gordonia malaquae]
MNVRSGVGRQVAGALGVAVAFYLVFMIYDGIRLDDPVPEMFTGQIVGTIIVAVLGLIVPVSTLVRQQRS